MKKIFRWIVQISIWFKRITIWIFKPKVLLLTILVIFLAVIIPVCVGGDFSFRLAGCILQILGIGTVAWGIRQTRKFFDRPGLLGHFQNWLKQFPKFRQDVVIMAGAGAFSLSAGKARVEVWKDAKDSSVEERLSAIEVNLGYLRNGIRSVEQYLDDSSEEQKAALKAEQEERQKGDAAIKDFITALTVGGLHISVMGLVWLFLGVCMSTFPGEIAGLME